MTERYAGKPFLRLLDSYVLDAIGGLTPENLAALEAMEPKLRDVYQTSGSWQSIVTSQMGFPDDLPRKIREIWEAGRPNFVAANGHEPDPVEFTQVFVDTNFPTE